MKLARASIIIILCLVFLAQFSSACISQPKIPDEVLATLGPFTLTTSVTPENGGTITSVQGEYERGTEVKITAEPEAGFGFVKWSGNASGNATEITIVMDSNKSVIANFGKLYTLQTFALPPDRGNVEPSSMMYADGSTVQITAIPEEDCALGYWSGAAEGMSDTTTIVMSGDTEATAHFSKVYPSSDPILKVALSDMELTTTIPKDTPESLKADLELPEGQVYAIIRMKIISIDHGHANILREYRIYDADNTKYTSQANYWTGVNITQADGPAIVNMELSAGSAGIIFFVVPEGSTIPKFRYNYQYYDEWLDSGEMTNLSKKSIMIQLQ